MTRQYSGNDTVHGASWLAAFLSRFAFSCAEEVEKFLGLADWHVSRRVAQTCMCF